jgi:uncharacterized protein YcbX
VATVALLSLTPVVSTRLLHPEAIDLGEHGVEGNRLFAFVLKSGRLYDGVAQGEMMGVESAYDAASDVLRLVFPDGEVAEAEVGEGGAEVTTPSFRTPGRHVPGPWDAPIGRLAGQEARLVRLPLGSYAAPVSLLGRASVADLAPGGPAPDERRFRMLVTLDGSGAHEESGWLGREVRVGDAVVRVDEHCARCVMTSRDPLTGVRDYDSLRAIRDRRGQAPNGDLNLGVYASVVSPGRVRVGDEVAPL